MVNNLLGHCPENFHLAASLERCSMSHADLPPTLLPIFPLTVANSDKDTHQPGVQGLGFTGGSLPKSNLRGAHLRGTHIRRILPLSNSRT